MIYELTTKLFSLTSWSYQALISSQSTGHVTAHMTSRCCKHISEKITPPYWESAAVTRQGNARPARARRWCACAAKTNDSRSQASHSFQMNESFTNNISLVPLSQLRPLTGSFTSFPGVFFLNWCRCHLGPLHLMFSCLSLLLLCVCVPLEERWTAVFRSLSHSANGEWEPETAAASIWLIICLHSVHPSCGAVHHSV